MTKKLEELFNMASADEGATIDETMTAIEENREVINTVNAAIDKIDEALPGVRDLDTSDNELDELADLAKENFDNLMSLGMNVESRYAGTIFQTAGVLLGHAITAKQAKINKKLSMIDLQLKKMRLDQNEASKSAPTASIDGEGVVLDRNALLKMLTQKDPKDTK